MTKDERQSLILDLLMQQDSLLVTDLSEQLNVSSVTIRKDLTELEKKKKLYRNHGKAILIDPYSENKNVSEKERLYVEEKRLIGTAAAQLITPRECRSRWAISSSHWGQIIPSTLVTKLSFTIVL